MLSPKTIRGLHGILHKALNQAAAIGYLRFNPADACNIPKVVRKELTPLDTEDIQKLLTEIRGNPFEILLSVTLFGRLREGEVLALSWHNIDFEYGMVLICQLQRFREGKGVYRIVPTKNSKGRTIKPATAVMDLLKRQKAIQAEMRLKAGTAWENNDFVFTNECGHHFDNSTIYRAFKKAATAFGRPDARFHDLRHPYVKHTTKIFSLRSMAFQAQAYPDARRKTRGACQLHRGGQSQSPVRPLCNRKRFSCLPPQAKMSWILYAISMRLSDRRLAACSR